jgi:hypothetical protein
VEERSSSSLPTPFFASPGGTPVRDAAFSLLPGVRPSAREAELPLLPGEWRIRPLPLSCSAPVPPWCIELVPSCIVPLPPDMPDAVPPTEPLLLAANAPVAASAAAVANANAVFLMLNLLDCAEGRT